jgi:DNA-binding MarR family transcriptional regulator
MGPSNSADERDRASAGEATCDNPPVKADHVDHLIEQWHRERPDLDVSPMEVIARISRLCRIFERRIEERYAGDGLNQAQFGVLAALRRAGPPHCLSPTELYESLLISSGAISHRLARLEASGYVRRLPDPTDGRGALVMLTPSGKRLIDRVLTKHYANEANLLASLSSAERATVAKILRELLLNFEEDPAPNGTRSTNGRSNRRPHARSAR